VVGTVDNDKTNSDELAEMMVGREVLSAFEKEHLAPGKTVLQVEGLSAFNDRKILALKHVAFEVREFQILGLAGVEGNGQTELVEVLTGLRNAKTGKISLDGTSITTASPHERIQKGLANVPEDRQKEGLILDFSVQENLILGQHDIPPFVTRWFTLNLRKISDYARDLIQEYSIKTRSRNAIARYLSGGTQQRVVVAREFSRKPKFIIACQPTRGLDIGATEYVRRKLVEMRDHGCAILLISADLDEILTLSDRIAVIYEGKLVAIRERIETNELELGLLMTGGKCD
jgi:simple sugar transport system ATP-binding protein